MLPSKGICEKSLLTHQFISRKWQEFDALLAEIESLEEEVGLAKVVTSFGSGIR